MSLDNTEQIMQLRALLKRMDREIFDLQMQRNRDMHQAQAIKKEKRDIVKRIDLLARERSIVTDHAVLRYLQRVKGIDIEAVRDEILAHDAAGLIDQLGNAKIPIGNGCRIVVEDYTVVTVLEKAG